MDQIKIGKYIAGKRKEQDLTQKQLAEKLGVSDKSVSKWERGICLPDVSLYTELCGALDISINEFFAGEDIARERIAEKSEENLIRAVTDHNHKQKRLKIWIWILAVIMLAAACFAWLGQRRPEEAKNYIYPLDQDSIERKTAKTISGSSVSIYRFETTDSYKTLKMYLSEFQSGDFVRKEECMSVGFEDVGSPKSGLIYLVPDISDFSVKVIFGNEGCLCSVEIPILEDVPEREYLARGASEIWEQTQIEYGTEQPLAALSFGRNQLRPGDLERLMNREKDDLFQNDYDFLFSFEFGK